MGQRSGFHGVPAFLNNVLKLDWIIFAPDAPLEGKTVLVLGGHRTLEVTLRCLIERNGMIAIISHWTSENFKSEVGFQLWYSILLSHILRIFFSFKPCNTTQDLTTWLCCHSHDGYYVVLHHMVAVAALSLLSLVQLTFVFSSSHIQINSFNTLRFLIVKINWFDLIFFHCSSLFTNILIVCYFLGDGGRCCCHCRGWEYGSPTQLG